MVKDLLNCLFKDNMVQKYPKISFNQNTMENLINQFTGKFLVGTEAPQYKDVKIAVFSQDKLTIKNEFKNLLKNTKFKDEINKIIEFGLHSYTKVYSDNYNNLSFTLYEKYTYDDVCRLLDWDKNEVPNNIGGYKYNKKTNTLPVFINYHKNENIADSINYDDHFVSRNVLSYISKNKRALTSPDVLKFTNAKENNTKILLFVRKNKDDKENAKKFYFLGEMDPIFVPKEITMSSGDKAVNFIFLLDTPVREDLFDYIVNK